jgi:diguanylate cyclase (GGDEF)-like protein
VVLAAGYHRSLERQLRRLALRPDTLPEHEQWVELLNLISSSYSEADADRYTLERSIEISSDEMRALHDVLRMQARHDVLTGLPNRSALTELLADALAAARHHGREVAVLFVDLDGFKLVNDSLGHSVGDELLVRAAERISGSVRERDIVARLGGDEFVVVCVDVDDFDTVVAIARRINAQLETPFRIGAQDSVVTASIGITRSGPGQPSAEELLRMADMAMYRAKTSGRSQYTIFDDDMRQQVDGRVATESALRHGIAHGELILHYQPIIALDHRRPIGMEALVRWQRPGFALVMPDAFIPIAEESNLINAIDCWVIREACREAARWPDQSRSIAVNLSARDLLRDDVVNAMSAALQDTGLAPRRLMMELTETTLMSDSITIANNIARIHSLGVQIAIDDFGTGYSSLSYLRKLPAQTLKIDRSFVSVVDEDQVAQTIVKAMIDMARALNLEVIAEGVERESQAQVLRGLGCAAAQGYHFGRPGPPGP